MKKIFFASLLTAGLFATTSCESYLDVNTNPNGPDQVVAPQFYLPAIQSELALGVQFDARYLGKYVQNWNHISANDVWDQHGFVASSDASGQLWRAIYYSMGANLTDMIARAEQEEKWDFAGVGYVLRAFGWQILTDYHGEVIVSQAFEPGRTSFDYDTQEEIYAEVRRLTMLAIQNLERTDGNVANSQLNRGDLIYGGDRTKWLKFAYGLLAINEHHLSNKASYNPDKVIEYVNKSLASNADDASVRFEGAVSNDTNFFGPRRGNLNTFRQSKFIVSLLDGTNPSLRDEALIGQDPMELFADQHMNDPRLPVMLSQAPDGEYRGVTPTVGVTEYEVAKRPRNLWNTPTDVVPATTPNKYLFGNNERFPIMTFSQLQFIKAEAAFIKGDKQTALDAYTQGVKSHLDFVQRYVVNDSNTPEDEAAVYTQRRQAYEASEELIPTSPATLTLQKIMLQKYIAQWGWGFVETWSDLRRYDYSGEVFTGFELPNPLYGLNQGQPAQRFRPRYNSEYMWNVSALEKVGGLNQDYHTYEMWFTKE
ncbi:SusD/RagB family nutrient-binding outer membrane lipoprotein [Pontibacter sp. HSC-14F20]|uniref:SusD/RagB family nutrient-binding outer membrane lipoprotein n=1 Tax=Pontibacter sp. HSC-14F20 TaxID=2864136 RepID=UPI001C72C835|nr:SusD/RagB family nutrient-binding outer membrane lipoprotein [Pontibacter sp. HSC-14F20]MBX0332659.1 SusD/RagB family nutrient-binding outer membrane lipoprotein [Pontibacter sp. HSC-14F20]